MGFMPDANTYIHNIKLFSGLMYRNKLNHYKFINIVAYNNAIFHKLRAKLNMKQDWTGQGAQYC